MVIAQAFFFLPDTLDRSGPKKSASPLQVLKIFFHPPITIISLLNASTFSIMFLFLFIFPVRISFRAGIGVHYALTLACTPFQIQLDKVYGLSELAIGLAYLPFGLGTCLGTVVGGSAADYCYAKKVRVSVERRSDRDGLSVFSSHREPPDGSFRCCSLPSFSPLPPLPWPGTVRMGRHRIVQGISSAESALCRSDGSDPQPRPDVGGRCRLWLLPHPVPTCPDHVCHRTAVHDNRKERLPEGLTR